MSRLTEDLERYIEELTAERDHLARCLHETRTERDKLAVDNQRLILKCNRMVRSASLEDIQGVGR